MMSSLIVLWDVHAALEAFDIGDCYCHERAVVPATLMLDFP